MAGAARAGCHDSSPALAGLDDPHVLHLKPSSGVNLESRLSLTSATTEDVNTFQSSRSEAPRSAHYPAHPRAAELAVVCLLESMTATA